MTQARISCYIRTLNEERLIGEVVRAALTVADEVVIVDSGSTDKTVEICEREGARVINQAWLGNGFQKRVGEEACRHDWLLDIDADEIVSPELATALKGLFSEGEPPHPCYPLTIMTVPPFGRVWKKAALTTRIKFYDRRVLRIPAHKAWDQFDVPAGIEPGKVKGALLHHSFRNMEHRISKLNRISTVRAQESRLKPYWVVVFRVLFALPFYFFKHYVLRGVWREGVYGFAMAITAALGRWLRDVKMLERHMGGDG